MGSSRRPYAMLNPKLRFAGVLAGGQSERLVPPAPIRAPEWSSRLSGQRQILFTQPCGMPEHKRHHGKSFRRLYFPWYVIPPDLSAFGHRAILIGAIAGGLRHSWGLYVEQTDSLQAITAASSTFCLLIIPLRLYAETGGCH